MARWRDDVDFVQAGIYCFQPYCVTGELDPPANPLICPQFCVRFNDLDNVGITGRHYSGFIMLGIQVFNKPNDRKFWADECVEFNYRWLTEELKIPADEITFIEDVWAGGGNLGPSIEYFVGGLEVGNMVFMQYKTFPDGRREPLDVQVIDVGIGLERIPWLINGSPTSYYDVFPTAFKYFLDTSGVELNETVWKKFGPLSCLLNVDEVDDVNKTWQWIAENVGMPVAEVSAAIEPIRDAYVILDHLRTAMMVIQDGALPANTGGGSNIRSILRRAFAIMTKNKWWDKFGLEGLLKICECHQTDLANIYGTFPPYKSFGSIIENEFKLYNKHDVEVMKTVRKIIDKAGKAGLSDDDWIKCVTTFGVPEAVLAKESGQPVPKNLWLMIDERQQQTMKMAAVQPYSLANHKPTESLYEDHYQTPEIKGGHRMYQFSGSTVVDVLNHQSDPTKPLNMVILDKSAFYPTSGGQDHDTGLLTIDGVTYEVVDVIKVGPCVLHELKTPLPSRDAALGKSASGAINVDRRDQLRCHHTAAHIICAAAKQRLGPHIYQAGARKKVTEAHLDITHFTSLGHEEVRAIEMIANRIVREGKNINKFTEDKDIAEQKYGFSLYQGGVVPGDKLRIVDIDETDTEACCGTHCDNTSEVGVIKIIGARRVTDGVVRLTFVAGERGLKELESQANMLDTLCDNLDVQIEHVVSTATSFFKQALSYEKRNAKQAEKILKMQLQLIAADTTNKLFVARTDETAPTMYVSELPAVAKALKAQGKGVIFVGPSYVYGFLGDAKVLDVQAAIGAKVTEFEAAVVARKAAAEAAAAEAKDAPAAAGGASSSAAAAAAAAPKKLIVKNTITALTVDQAAGKKAKPVKENLTDVALVTGFALQATERLWEYLTEAAPKGLGLFEI